MVKQSVIELEDTLEDIPPQAFNPLVVNTSSNNHASSTWSSKRMLQHVHRNLCVLSSLVTSNTRWKDAWNMHPLRTESNNTPVQIWTRGLLALQQDLHERDDELLDEVLIHLCMYVI